MEGSHKSKEFEFMLEEKENKVCEHGPDMSDQQLPQNVEYWCVGKRDSRL